MTSALKLNQSIPLPTVGPVQSLLGRLERISKDVFQTLILSFLDGQSTARLASVSRFWWSAVGSRIIALLIDNTGSMRSDNREDRAAGRVSYQLQERFLVQFLLGLNDGSKVLLCLLRPTEASEAWKKQRFEERLLTRKQALSVVLNHIVAPMINFDMDMDMEESKETPNTKQDSKEAAVMEASLTSIDDFIPSQYPNRSFYSGTKTPLLQRLSELVNRGLRLIVCPTDGEDTVTNTEEAFRAIPLLKHSTGTIMDRYNNQPKALGGTRKKKHLLEFDEDNRLESWCEVLYVALPETQNVLISLVGIYNNGLAKTIPGFKTANMHSLDSVDDIAEEVRLATIPDRAGGGRGSRSVGALMGERAAAAEKDKGHLAETLYQRLTLLPPPTSHAAKEQLLGERVRELQAIELKGLTPPTQWKVRELPPKIHKEPDPAEASASASASEEQKTKSGRGRKKKAPEAKRAQGWARNWHTAHMVGRDPLNKDAKTKTPRSSIPIVLEMQETYAELCKEWEQICANPKEFARINRLAQSYRLQKGAAPPLTPAGLGNKKRKLEDGKAVKVAVTVSAHDSIDEIQAKAEQLQKALDAMRAMMETKAKALKEEKMADADGSGRSSPSPSDVKAASDPTVLTVDDMILAQSFVSPIEAEYELRMANKRHALEKIVKERVYPIPPALFYAYHYREKGKQTPHNRLLGVSSELPEPMPLPKARRRPAKSSETKKETKVGGKDKAPVQAKDQDKWGADGKADDQDMASDDDGDVAMQDVHEAKSKAAHAKVHIDKDDSSDDSSKERSEQSSPSKKRKRVENDDEATDSDKE